MVQPQKQTRLRAIVFAFACLYGAAVVQTNYCQQATSPSGQSPPASQSLQDEKLREEINKLKLENKKLSGGGELILSYMTLLTGLVAVGGLIATFWKQISDSTRQKNVDFEQRERDLEQREREREQRAEEGRRRLEERFTAIVNNLGSESASLQASAAVSIMTFLKPQHEEFHTQVYWTLLANLKVQQPQALNNLLVSGFSPAIRSQRQLGSTKDLELVVDLSRCNLDRIDLSGLDLTGADVAFSHLAGANITGSDLFRIRGREAHLVKARLSRSKLGEGRFRRACFNGAQFHESNLVAADLRETDLQNTQFQKAQMQSAHLDRADLRGARFEEANLNDTFFRGAVLSKETLKSILVAHNWEKAHFDQDIRDELEALDKQRVKK
jgi:uncharacterized protein YjbI with pentapeptide repeats